jgi:aspartyl-tRNA(Asn)/glutamyl-tRNA(Gln) amidotransferase subunit C
MNKEEIQHLANLSRLELTDEELEKYSNEFGKIISYVDKIKEISDSDNPEPADASFGVAKNVFREDDNVQETGEYTEKILNEAPDTHEGFVKVKKILNND